MLNNEDSLRLQLLRFPLIVGVVFIHAYGATLVFANKVIGASENNFLSNFIQHLISEEIARCAVPIFFLMSGYLFFNSEEWSKEIYFTKIKSRIKTLLIPFLFWNILILVIFSLAQSHPVTQNFFSGKKILISQYDLIDYIKAVFGIGRMPVSYQFWFIRDLIALSLLTPIIYYLNKKFSIPFIFVLFILWVINFSETESCESILFFVVGCYAGSKNRNLFTFDKYFFVLLLSYCIIATANTFFFDSEFYMYMRKLGIIIGSIVFLSSTKYLLSMPRIKKVILSLSSASFFVYAAHEPLLTIIKKISYKILLPQNGILILSIYFCSAFLTIFILIYLYRILSYHFPIFTAYITGGR